MRLLSSARAPRGGNVTAGEVGREQRAFVDGAATVRRPQSRGRTIVLCLTGVGLATVAYHPVTANYFFADDFLNLYHIVNDPLKQYLVTPNGGHALLARNAVFYAGWRVFGTDPAPYFWTVLLTHLVNVALAFRVLRAWNTANSYGERFRAHPEAFKDTLTGEIEEGLRLTGTDVARAEAAHGAQTVGNQIGFADDETRRRRRRTARKARCGDLKRRAVSNVGGPAGLGASVAVGVAVAAASGLEAAGFGGSSQATSAQQ